MPSPLSSMGKNQSGSQWQIEKVPRCKELRVCALRDFPEITVNINTLLIIQFIKQALVSEAGKDRGQDLEGPVGPLFTAFDQKNMTSTSSVHMCNESQTSSIFMISECSEIYTS